MFANQLGASHFCVLLANIFQVLIQPEKTSICTRTVLGRSVRKGREKGAQDYVPVAGRNPAVGAGWGYEANSILSERCETINIFLAVHHLRISTQVGRRDDDPVCSCSCRINLRTFKPLPSPQRTTRCHLVTDSRIITTSSS